MLIKVYFLIFEKSNFIFYHKYVHTHTPGKRYRIQASTDVNFDI